MKRISRLSIACLAALLAAVMPSGEALGQVKYGDLHFGAAWQMYSPFSGDFADKLSGWGMGFDVAYDITPRWTVGGFFNFHTNHKYVERQTLVMGPTQALTTDQQRSYYQLPFGASAGYTLWDNAHFRPYVGAKVGAMYSKATTYYGTGGVYDKSWGFYVSPEVGAVIYPAAGKRFGFKIAGYYSYATNQTATLDSSIDGQSGAGFRVGVVF